MVALSVPMIVAAPWMHLGGDRRGQLFLLRWRFLPGWFSGKQRRVYSVSPLRARSQAAEKDFQKVHASTKPVLSKAEGLSTNGQ